MVGAGGLRYDSPNDVEWIHSGVPASLLLTPNLDWPILNLACSIWLDNLLIDVVCGSSSSFH